VTDILMPALSPTMEEGTLAKWLVKAGDTVKSGDIIAEIETDKATMEVEAVDEGVVDTILVAEGTENVKVNAPIARLLGEGETKAAPPAPKEAPPSPPERRRPAGPSDVAVDKKSAGETPALRPQPDGERIPASPLARRIALQKGLDLSAIEGSGPHGRIIRRDVDGARAAPAPVVTAVAQFPREFASLEKLGIPDGTYDLFPLDNIRKTVARRLTDSWRDVPHFPLTVDLVIDDLLAARGKINAALAAQGVKVSVNDLVIKAAALALKRVPAANASYTPNGVALHHNADIAVAVAIDGGLITPIVRAAETKSLAVIAAEMKDLAARARDRKLKPQEFQGGTFSISNLGMFGIKSFASIINEPQGAILSVGVGEKRPVVVGDALAVATVMSVTLTCDHRVIDGVIGATWLQAFKTLIEDPITMLA
jgi:pyruvate dehydrogenase E2 component (dihydrolipoamide acetyltransferase)